MHWDIFCKVIDNHGDAGVTWRLAAELARRGMAVRLWIDDPSPLQWLAPRGQPGVEVIAWHEPAPALVPGDVVIEAFGCDPPQAFVARLAQAARERGHQPPWINLEYLSAEGYVQRSHGLPSPVSAGPGAGLTKHFFYPGFDARTGGLLREQGLQTSRNAFDRAGWLRAAGIRPGAQALSLFCYEPPALPQLLRQLAGTAQPTDLLVTAGRATAAARRALADLATSHPGWNAAGQLRLRWLPLLPQAGYDELLWACDLNFVRGEDSLVRGLLAGRPCVWQIYPQGDGAHQPKLDAFLDWLAPPLDLRSFMRTWNGLDAAPLALPDAAGWRGTATAALTRIKALPELAAALEQFARERSRI